jgi:biotin/methionine sulfoxide reductase
MDQVISPVGDARDDHEIFRGIAALMGCEDAFTEGRSPQEWQRWIYDRSRQQASRAGVELPSWDEFQQDGWVKVPAPETQTIMMDTFRADPEANPLETPSGKIEIFSDTIAGFDYDDCPGHPVWLEPLEWLGKAEPAGLHMISNQPHNKLHSQLDHGHVSRSDRPRGHEPVMMHPGDAEMRNLTEGQIVRIHNARGACLADLRISDDIRPGVIQIATGAWFDPDGETCKRGNPNVLTPDKGTSRLAQGPIAHSCLVEVVAYDNLSPAKHDTEMPVT